MNEKAKCKNCTDEMIEEMAKDLEMVEKEAFSKIAKETQLYVKENHRYNSKEDYSLAHTKTIYELVAEALIKLGYTKNKIPEGSVVLTKEEYEKLTRRRFIITSKPINPVEEILKQRNSPFIVMQDDIEIKPIPSEEEIRKETAKEILQSLLDFVNCEKINQGHSFEKIKETLIKVAKTYEVEVEE